MEIEELKLEELKPGVLLVDRFEIKVRLAAGGYGNIWKAVDILSNKRVAIKILHVNAGNNDPHAIVRMRQEADVLASISHPNIVKIFGFFTSDYGEFIAMELLRGLSLDQWIETKGKGTDAQMLAIILELLDALDACHKTGVIHRDIKPGNIILVSEKGRYRGKLVDFGIAKASQILTDLEKGTTLVQTLEGGFMGTPRYAAPELVVGDPFGINIDLYSLGLVIAEWLTGRPRMDGETHGDVMTQVISEKPIDISDCSPRWRKWLTLMIDRDPNQRFQDAKEAMDALEKMVVDVHQPADFVETEIAVSHLSTHAKPTAYSGKLEIDSGIFASRAKRQTAPFLQPEKLPPVHEFLGIEKEESGYFRYFGLALFVFAIASILLMLLL